MFERFKSKKHNNLQLDASYIYQLDAFASNKRDYQQNATEAYCSNVVAHRAINMIVQSAASVPVKVTHKNEIVESSPINSLLSRPNPFQSFHEFMEMLYAHKLISGNAYVLAITNEDGVGELHLLRPDRVTIDNNMSFIYTLNNQKFEYPVHPVTGTSCVLHLKNFNPISDKYGLSSVEPAGYSIDQHNLAGQWNQALLKNGARPSGAIIVKNSNGLLTDKQYIQLKSSIDDLFSGSRNAGRPILLEGGMEWKEMSLTPKDMDFIESKHSSARDIALALGLPPQLLGIPGDNTYANLAEARLAFWEQTVIPLVDNVISSMSHWLCGFYDGNMRIEYDLNSVSALSVRRDALWERAQNCAFLTVNEKREMVGLCPIEGGDKL